MPRTQLTPRELTIHPIQIVVIHQTPATGLHHPAAALRQEIASFSGVGQGPAVSPTRKTVGAAPTGVQVADQGVAAKLGLQAPSGDPELVPPSVGLAHTIVATCPSRQRIESAATLHIAQGNTAAPVSIAITAADTTGACIDEPHPPRLTAAPCTHTPATQATAQLQ